MAGSSGAAIVAERVLAFLNGILAAIAMALWPRGRPAEAENIAVYRPGAVGDLVCALPALWAIRRAYPRSRIFLLTFGPSSGGSSVAAEIVECSSCVDEVIIGSKGPSPSTMERLLWAASLRGRRFDIWIELPEGLLRFRGALRNIAMAFLSGAKWARGWRLSVLRLLARAQSESAEFPNEVMSLLRGLGRLGFHVDPSLPPPPLVPTPRHIDNALRLLNRAGLGGPYVVISPAVKRPVNVWPRERFVAVGKELLSRGFGVVILGSDSDEPLCGAVAREIGAGAISLAGQTSVMEAAAVIGSARLLFGGDSGLQHIAAALAVPAIAVFSSWEPRGMWRPHSPLTVLLRKDVPCHTCYEMVCPFENHCMRLTEAAEVVEAAVKMLRPTGE